MRMLTALRCGSCDQLPALWCLNKTSEYNKLLDSSIVCLFETGRGYVEYGTANPHLNVFEPYRELGRAHEDQLTRAAMIVLRLVPMAREALL
jgi:hypothetical protein